MNAFRLALANLLHDRGRSAVSVVGAAFAVVLIFMQLGFLGATRNTATILYDRLQFDLLLVSSEYLDFSRPGALDRVRLAQARSAPGVRAVRPLSTAQGLWRNPATGRRWAIVMLGVDPAGLDAVFFPDAPATVFPTAADRAARDRLTRSDAVLLDRRSQPYFGGPNLAPETRAEFNGRQVELAGYFEVGTGFSYTGLLLASEETFAATTGRPRDKVALGLVTLEPGTDPVAAAASLRAALPRDVLVFTRRGVGDFERTFWIEKTAVGQFFTFGVVLALLVGAIFVYQMMVADIKKHLPEYATLKAMGYRFRFLFAVVAWQSLFLAAGGYVLGLAASLVLYQVAIAASPLPMWMTWGRVVLVLGLTVGMCVGSGLAAVRRVRRADPAELF